MRQPGMSIMTEKDLEFADPKEEATYWKQIAEEYERKLVKKQVDFVIYYAGIYVKREYYYFWWIMA